jgi:hypothetical protein
LDVNIATIALWYFNGLPVIALVLEQPANGTTSYIFPRKISRRLRFFLLPVFGLRKAGSARGVGFISGRS